MTTLNPKYQPLFDPITFRSGTQLKNRIVMAPMTNFSSNPDGTVSKSEVNYYVRRSGGVGAVITACTNVTANGKGFDGEFAAHTDAMIPSLKTLAEGIQHEGAKAILQIFHGGRMCPPALVPDGDVVSASAVAAEGEGAAQPRELTDSEIEEIVTAFGEAARRAIEAGYDGVEIHGANGYLIQQFFSPHSNRRTDKWGGTVEKRMTFPLAVVDEVKRVVKQYTDKPFIVGYRFSPEEATSPGISMADTLQLVDALAGKELDYLHASLMDFRSVPRGGFDGTKSRLTLIQERVGERSAVIGVGSIHTAEEALEAITSGVSLVALGRELIMEPEWVQKLEAGREDELAVTLSRADQERLTVPGPLWQAIVNTPGWFPVVD